jgi:tetratricopeptide (TPR) repeat protein
MGRIAEALADYEKAVSCKPDFADAYANRAVALYRMKNYGKALEDVKTCRELGGRPDPAFLKALDEAARGGDR